MSGISVSGAPVLSAAAHRNQITANTLRDVGYSCSSSSPAPVSPVPVHLMARARKLAISALVSGRSGQKSSWSAGSQPLVTAAARSRLMASW